MSSNNKSKLTEAKQFKKFSCKHCSVELKDVKLLKVHYWKVHIQKKDIFNFMKPADTLKITNTVKKSTITNRKRKLNDKSVAPKSQAKRRNETLPDDSLNDIDSTFNTSQTTDILNSLDSEKLKTYNLKGIDEAKLFEKFNISNPGRNRNFSEKQIVWARYRSKMWPASIAKLAKNKSGSINRVFVSYFELNSKKSLVFKLEPSKVSGFFSPVETHCQYKQAGAEDIATRFEFLSCYTDALNEFCALVDNETPTDKPESVKLVNCPTDESREMYYVLDCMMSKQEIIEIASKEFSESHENTVKEREEYSQRLINVLTSSDCHDYIVGILSKTIHCKRVNDYLCGTLKDRKEMRFCSPGPLLIDHQKKLADNLQQLESVHFSTKPAHLTSFTYDVIYPEAVIWAIKRLDKCSTAKATSTYKIGFRQTSEEARKQRCNELLAEWRNEDNISEFFDSKKDSAGFGNGNDSSLSMELTRTSMSEYDTIVTDTLDLIVCQIEKQDFEKLNLHF